MFFERKNLLVLKCLGKETRRLHRPQLRRSMRNKRRLRAGACHLRTHLFFAQLPVVNAPSEEITIEFENSNHSSDTEKPISVVAQTNSQIRVNFNTKPQTRMNLTVTTK